MLILVLLDMYFDAAGVFVTKSSLLFRLAVAILWVLPCCGLESFYYHLLGHTSFLSVLLGALKREANRISTMRRGHLVNSNCF